MARPAPRSLYVVYTNPLGGEEDALHAWYEEVHIPDSLAAGLFESVARYRAIVEGGARFLTLWGCNYASEDEALAAVRPVALKLRERGRIEVVQEVVFQQFVFLDPSVDATDVREASQLVAFQSTWSRPGSVAAFDAWVTKGAGAEHLVSSPSARYGVPDPAKKALVLLGGAAATDSWPPEDCAEGLPPCGDPTPIFEGGSPAPGPDALEADELARREAMADVWATRWERISLR